VRSELLIGGEWIAGSSGSTFATYDPATGEEIARVSLATAADVDAAVVAATEAFEASSWSGLTAPRRARLLFRLADLIDDHADELARLETIDQGQPLTFSTNRTLPSVAEYFRYYGGWATKIHGITGSVSVPDVDYRMVREPLGVVGLITPWNFPLTILAFKLAPALAAGNTVVIKPAELTSLSTLRLAELTQEAGFPPGVVNVVLGGPDIGRALVRHPAVAKIAFTGSTEVGREIGEVAGRQFKRVSLELGGKSPSIVAEDADIDKAVAGNLAGGLTNAGQVCAAYTRMYVARPRLGEFVDKLAAGAAAMKVGPGLETDTQMGPLISPSQLARVHSYVESGLAEGAELVTGGARAEGDLAAGNFYLPTVFANVTQTMRIAREEIFGPVLSVLAYDDLEGATAMANDSDYGLAAVIWSRDITTVNQLSRRIRAGTVWVNMAPILDPAATWGGVKSSGIGREMGWEGIAAFTEVKSIWTNFAT
jgi:acyl-CoA reductase-like NAD-dependent aldehyde dehydrogenase